MGYYYNFQKQGNYSDADTSRYLKHKLFLALQVNIQIGKENIKRDHTNIDIFPLE